MGDSGMTMSSVEGPPQVRSLHTLLAFMSILVNGNVTVMSSRISQYIEQRSSYECRDIQHRKTLLPTDK